MNPHTIKKDLSVYDEVILVCIKVNAKLYQPSVPYDSRNKRNVAIVSCITFGCVATDVTLYPEYCVVGYSCDITLLVAEMV